MTSKRGTYVPGHREPYRHGRHPARCNKRECQTRRNLSKHPALYREWPRCRVPGCGGKMYVDWYRKKKGPKDNAPVCRDPLCDHYRETGNFVPHHRVSSKGCSGYEDYRWTRGKSKHSPTPVSKEPPF